MTVLYFQLMWAVAILAVAALAADLTVYVAGILGFNPRDWIKPDWLAATLFFGLVGVVAVGANLVEAYRKRREERQDVQPAEVDRPRWFKVVMPILVVFAFSNLFAFGCMRYPRGEPVEMGVGLYGIDPGHGRPVVPITKEQYLRYRRDIVCALAGFFLLFYLPIAFDMVCLASGRNLTGPRSEARNKHFRWVFVIRRRD